MKTLLILFLAELSCFTSQASVVILNAPTPNGLFSSFGVSIYRFDFDSNGSVDLTFNAGIEIYGFHVTGPATSEIIAGVANGYYGAAVLGPGTTFSPSLLPSQTNVFGARYHSFLTGQEATMSFISSESSGGTWEGQTGYLGFSFLIGQERHYGWIYHQHISSIGGYFYQYAYETEPGVGITTPIPESSSAALLLLGTGVLLSNRNRKFISLRS
jgi:hypothetical protein